MTQLASTNRWPSPPPGPPPATCLVQRAVQGEFAPRVPLPNLLTRRRILSQIPFLCAADQPATPSWQQHHQRRQPPDCATSTGSLASTTATTTSRRQRLDRFTDFPGPAVAPRATPAASFERIEPDRDSTPLDCWETRACSREDARGCCIACWELYAGNTKGRAIITNPSTYWTRAQLSLSLGRDTIIRHTSRKPHRRVAVNPRPWLRPRPPAGAGISRWWSESVPSTGEVSRPGRKGAWSWRLTLSRDRARPERKMYRGNERKPDGPGPADR
jgi:hypothetical protein